MLYAEVSAKTKQGLNELFEKVVDIVLEARKAAVGGASGASATDAGTVVAAKKKKKTCVLV